MAARTRSARRQPSCHPQVHPQLQSRRSRERAARSEHVLGTQRSGDGPTRRPAAQGEARTESQGGIATLRAARLRSVFYLLVQFKNSAVGCFDGSCSSCSQQAVCRRRRASKQASCTSSALQQHAAPFTQALSDSQTRCQVSTTYLLSGSRGAKPHHARTRARKGMIRTSNTRGGAQASERSTCVTGRQFTARFWPPCGSLRAPVCMRACRPSCRLPRAVCEAARRGEGAAPACATPLPFLLRATLRRRSRRRRTARWSSRPPPGRRQRWPSTVVRLRESYLDA